MDAISVCNNLIIFCDAIDVVDPYGSTHKMHTTEKVLIVAICTFRIILNRSANNRFSNGICRIGFCFCEGLRVLLQTVISVDSNMSGVGIPVLVISVKIVNIFVQLEMVTHPKTWTKEKRQFITAMLSANLGAYATSKLFVEENSLSISLWEKRNQMPFILETDSEIPECLHKDYLFKQYICPLTQKTIRHPVSDPDGVTLYERSAIEAWIRTHGTSPTTHTYLHPDMLIPRPVLAGGINDRIRSYRVYWYELRDSPLNLKWHLNKFYWWTSREWNNTSFFYHEVNRLEEEEAQIAKEVQERSSTRGNIHSYMNLVVNLPADNYPQKRLELLKALAKQGVTKAKTELQARIRVLQRHRMDPISCHNARVFAARLDTLPSDAITTVVQLQEHIRDLLSRFNALLTAEDLPLIDQDTIPEALSDDIVFRRFVCPITNRPIRDPVGAPDGVILYEKSAILARLQEHKTCPITGSYLTPFLLRPMPKLKTLIENRIEMYDRVKIHIKENPRRLEGYLRKAVNAQLEQDVLKELEQLASRALDLGRDIREAIQAYQGQTFSLSLDSLASIIHDSLAKIAGRAKACDRLKNSSINQPEYQTSLAILEGADKVVATHPTNQPATWAKITEMQEEAFALIDRLTAIEHELDCDLLEKDDLPAILEKDPILGKYMCPISKCLIKDPVSDPNGHAIYERASILEWLETNRTSPVTMDYLHPGLLVEKPAVKALIEARLLYFSWSWHLIQENGDLFADYASKPSDKVLMEKVTNEEQRDQRAGRDLIARIDAMLELHQPVDKLGQEYKERLDFVKKKATAWTDQTISKLREVIVSLKESTNPQERKLYEKARCSIRAVSIGEGKVKGISHQITWSGGTLEFAERCHAALSRVKQILIPLQQEFNLIEMDLAPPATSGVVSEQLGIVERIERMRDETNDAERSLFRVFGEVKEWATITTKALKTYMEEKKPTGYKRDSIERLRCEIVSLINSLSKALMDESLHTRDNFYKDGCAWTIKQLTPLVTKFNKLTSDEGISRDEHVLRPLQPMPTLFEMLSTMRDGATTT